MLAETRMATLRFCFCGVKVAGTPFATRSCSKKAGSDPSPLPASFSIGVRLVCFDNRDSFVDVMMGLVDVIEHARLQAPNRRIVFFLGDVAVRLVQQLA